MPLRVTSAIPFSLVLRVFRLSCVSAGEVRKTTDRFLTTLSKGSFTVAVSVVSSTPFPMISAFDVCRTTTALSLSATNVIGCVSLTLLLARRAVIICVPANVPVREAIATPLLSVMPFPPLLIENRLATSFGTVKVISLSFSGLPFLSCKVAVICCGAVLVTVISPEGTLRVRAAVL